MEGQELAERHIALRERAGLTQEQEAKMAGVSPTTISGIESGRITRPHLKTLLKIARALGTDLGELRESGKAQAPSSQRSLFNGDEEERRGDFLQSCRRYVQSRAEHYERRLAEAQEGGFFAGHEGSLILLGEALEEYDELGALLAGDLPDLFVEDRSDDAVMRSAVEAAAALRPLFKTLERISDRADELAETEAQKAEAAIRREEMRAHTERLSA